MKFSLFKLALKNKLLHFIFSRYVTYFIQFINSILIATYLGPFYLGVWGFLNLMIQYCNQLNLGIPYALNTIAATKIDDKEFIKDIFSVSNGLTLVVCGLMASFFYLNNTLNWGVGGKYLLDDYYILLIIIVCLNALMANFFNIFRVYGRLFELAFSQTILPVLILLCILFFKGKMLLGALVWANLIAFASSLALYILRSPVPLRLKLNPKIIEYIRKKAWFLFLYNAYFYFLMISTRSIISAYFPVSVFGYFTFSFSLANVILLFFESFSTLIYPKVINRLAHSTNEESHKLITSMRLGYTGLAHCLVHLVVLLAPLIAVVFPKYSNAIPAFRLITITQLLYTNCLGYQDLLIAKSKEKAVSRVAFITLCINITGALLMIKFGVGFEYIILATLVSLLFFTYNIAKLGLILLDMKSSSIKMFLEVFPAGLIIPYLTSLLLMMFQAPVILFSLPFILFVVLNTSTFKEVANIIKRIIKSPDIVNI